MSKDKIVSSADEFENLDLDIETPSTPASTEEESLDLDAATADTTPPSLPEKSSKEATSEIDGLDDLNLDGVEPAKEVPTTPAKDTLAPEVKNPLDVELEIDLEIPTTKHDPATDGKKVETVEKPKVETKPEPEKKGRKATVKKPSDVPASGKADPKTVETPKVETPKESKKEVAEMILHPLFDITKINTGKYQSRQIDHSAEEISAFAKILKAVGQVEPVHVVVEGDAFQLVAGFKRHAAMLLNGSKTIKAIVHTNITQEEIMKISSGTNSERKELSDWDKIGSVGLFANAHPELHPDKHLVTIFGYGKSTIYKYIDLYKKFTSAEAYPELLEIIKLYRLKLHAIETIASFCFGENAKYMKKEPVIENITLCCENKVIETKKDFESYFSTFFVEMVAKNKEDSEKIITTSDGETTPDDLGDLDLPDTKNDPTKDIPGTKDAGKENPKKDHEVNVLLKSVLGKAEGCEQDLLSILAIEDANKYADSALMKKVHNKLTKIFKMLPKLI